MSACLKRKQNGYLQSISLHDEPSEGTGQAIVVKAEEAQR
jgi:hypothetical protein